MRGRARNERQALVPTRAFAEVRDQSGVRRVELRPECDADGYREGGTLWLRPDLAAGRPSG